MCQLLILVRGINIFKWYRKAHRPIEWTYGEVSYYGLNKVFNEIPAQYLTSFMDIGSGNGKLVFFSRLLFKMNSIGIEIDSNMAFYASVLRRFFCISKVSFIHSDVKLLQLEDVAVYFFAGTCFSDETIRSILDQLNRKKHHFFVLSVSKPLENCDFKFNTYVPVLCSWGFDVVYIYEHLAETGV